MERRINNAEAAVVRRIFDLSANGYGLTRITKALNTEGAVSPRAQQGRPSAWAPSSVRAILLRPLYTGAPLWNQTQKRDRWGRSRRSDRPSAEWLHLDQPHLQIVPPDLWQAAQARFHQRHAQYSQGERRERVSRYLLAGFARCACCGGGFTGHSRSHGQARAHFYGCTSHWKRGSAVCQNNLVGRQDAIDAEVLAVLEQDVLRASVIEQAIALALDALHLPRRDDQRQALERERQTVQAECERLAEAVGMGGPMAALVARLQARQARLAELDAPLLVEAGERRQVETRAGWERHLRAKLADVSRLLQSDLDEARNVLRTLLVGPLRFTPVVDDRRRGYRFEGAIALDRLVSGIVDLPTGVASPTGFADNWNVAIEALTPPRAA